MTPIRRIPALGTLLLVSSVVFAAQAPVEEAAVPDDQVLVPPPSLASPGNPAADCYQAARGRPGTGRMEQDAYVCDLAVQMGRDESGAAGRGALAAALANRSLVLARSGRLEPALADLDEALGLAPDDARLHGNRGLLLMRMNRLEDALAAHDRAVTLAPRDPTGYYNRAFLYRALGEPALAAEDAAYARELLGQPGGPGSGPEANLPDTAGPAAGRAR